MDNLEIKVSNTLGSISTNFEEIEANLKEILANYKGIIVTEDTVKESKKDIAELRKIRTSIDDKKKEIKKVWNLPYIEFENKCKALMALVDAPIDEINSQVAEFEEKRKVEKIKHIRGLYDEHIGEYGDYLPFGSVFDNRWLNVSTTDRDIVFTLSEKITKVRSEIDAIKALHSEIESECLRVYKESDNSLTAAITKNSDYLTAKEIAKKRLEEEKKAEGEKKAVEEQVAAIPDEGFMNPPEYFDLDHIKTFRIFGDENIQKVIEFMEFSDIRYCEV